MKFNEYQEAAKQFARYNKTEGLMYLSLGLGNEAGEWQGTVKKMIRDGTELDLTELGDVLWYLAMLCNELEISLEDIALGNINKLRARAKGDSYKSTTRIGRGEYSFEIGEDKQMSLV